MSNSENSLSLLREFLTKQIESRSFIELSRGTYDIEPICGVIRKLKGNLVYVQISNRKSLLDVVAVLFLSDVSTVRTVSADVTSIEYTQGAFLEIFDTLPDFKINTIWKVASWAEEKFGAVNLYFEGIEPEQTGKGKILKQDMDYVLIQELDSTGKEPIKKSVFERKFITRLDFGDIYS